MIPGHPILSCDEAKQFEAAYFAGDEEREWIAMQQAGRAVADAVMRDFRELGDFPEYARVLVLAGKGHNAGDALIAARRIAEVYPLAQIEVRFVFGQRALKPLVQRAWRELSPVAIVAVADAGPNVGRLLAGARTSDEREQARGLRRHSDVGTVSGYDVVIDGIFGYQFRPPLDPATAALLAGVNALPNRFRAAVDLPSGLDDPSAFRADFTYATGIVKTPLLALPNAGRIRYLDLGFFNQPPSAAAASDPVCHLLSDKLDRVVTQEVLAPLRGLRVVQSDKRTYGHVFIVGGSRSYPGAVLMAVLAALRSGVGLVTAFVPESLAPAFAARAPEAMWVGWPETPDGGLAMEGSHLLQTKLDRAGVLLIGPGLAREPETLALAKDIVGQSKIPLVIDGDALQPEIVAAGNAPRILTPHAGEYARIEKKIPSNAVTIRKSAQTWVEADGVRYHGFSGGPVLARGGSGDLLAGLTAGLLAQTPDDPSLAACRGTLWHGLAADELARTHGQVAVNTTQLVDFLPVVLRDSVRF